MQRMIKGLLAATPFMVVGGLLYAALFIKPAVEASQLKPPAIQRGEFMYGIAAPSRQQLLGVGSVGKVWRSQDLGASWTVGQSPAQQSLQDVAAWDRERAVAVGDGGMVLASHDGGETWSKAEAALRSPAKLVRVRTAAPAVAWAVGEMGVALATADYGATWSRKTPDEDKAWNDVGFAGPRTVLVGEFGRISVSADDGATWTAVSSPVKTSLMAVAFRDDLHGVAVGLDGAVVSTADGGLRWKREQQVSAAHLFDVSWDGAQWLAVGEAGVLLRGHADGSAWRAARIVDGNRQWHTRILPVGQVAIASGEAVNQVDRR
ncbi:hypothetical protein BJN34_09710 [Cupriavidus necator]|uniref:Photosynthesis system II assembly factor Ycf48/Hcf136-like domain-containing protein n=1 Tax=Cupriavidus necator TaxID=106590 RepID=A0A1U9UNE6_CUPNE|nr:YCF48-related protein [Cupriavidus necator]AQV94163.1 hypothetical protein BJN34_09710 [Cupriavidus necator]